MLRKMDAGAERERAQAAAERYLSHASTEARNQIWTPLNRQMIELQRWLRDDVERRVKERGARLEAEAGARREAAQQDLGARTQQKQAADDRLKALAPLATRLASLADGLQDPAP